MVGPLHHAWTNYSMLQVQNKIDGKLFILFNLFSDYLKRVATSLSGW